VHAQSAPNDVQSLARQIEAQQAELDAQRKLIEALQRRLDGMPAAGRDAAAAPPAAPPAAPSRPATTARAPEAPKPVGRSPESTQEMRPAEIPALVDIRGVLTPRNTLVLEPSIQYSHANNNRVALVGLTIIPALTIGLIDVRSVNRDIFIGQLAARYGVTNRFEIEAKLPYVYRHDSNLTRPLATPSTTESVFEVSGRNIGDVELAARYQLNAGGPNSAYYVGNLRVKTRTGKDPFSVELDPATNLERELPTGTGFWAVQPSLTAIYPSDPAVFFGNVSYLWHMKRDIGGRYGTVDPGDAIGFSGGMGLALNEKASFSLGYDHSTVLRTKQNGQAVVTSRTTQLGHLVFGFSYRLSNRTSVNLSLGVGVTDEAPDMQATLRVPMSF
jgi:hypothetical protein